MPLAEWMFWIARLLGLVFGIAVALTLLALVLLLLVLALGFVSKLFVKDIVDPELGEVQIGWRQCEGKINLQGRQRTKFSLPLERRRIIPKAKDLLLRTKADWPRLKGLLLDHFATEVVEEGVPPDTIKRAKWVEKLARERDLENLQRFTRLQEIEVEYAEKGGPLQVRISTLHRWDPEHDRVLILDENLGVKFYALGCEC